MFIGDDDIIDLSQPISYLVASIKYKDLTSDGTPQIIKSLDAFVDHDTSSLPKKPQLLQFLQQFKEVEPLFSGNYPKNQKLYITAALIQESVLHQWKSNDVPFHLLLIAVALHLLIVTNELDELAHCERPPEKWWSEPPGRHLSLQSRITDRKGGPCPSIELCRTYDVSRLPRPGNVFPLPQNLEQLFQETLALLLQNRPEDWLFYFSIEFILGRIITNLNISDWSKAFKMSHTVASTEMDLLKSFAKVHVTEGITPFDPSIDVGKYKAKVPRNPWLADIFGTMNQIYIDNLEEAREHRELLEGQEG